MGSDPPDNPYEADDVPQRTNVAAPAAPPGGYDTSRGPFSHDGSVDIEQWSQKKWYPLRIQADKLKPDELETTRAKWESMIRDLNSAFQGLDSSMKPIVTEQWNGAAATAAQAATQAYVAENKALEAAISTMKGNLSNLKDALSLTKENLPTAQEVKEKAEELLNADIQCDVSVSIDESGEATVHCSCNYCRPDAESALSPIITQVNDFARGVMRNNYDPAIRSVNSSLPVFTAPPGKPDALQNPSQTPNSTPGGTGGGSGSGHGGGGGTPTTTTPSLNHANLKTPTTTTPNNTPTSTNSPTDSLKNALSGLSGLSGLGQNLASQAQNLGKNLTSQNKKTTPTPSLINQNKKKATTAGKSAKHGGGGGAGGGKSGGAGGGSGSKTSTPLLRDSLSNAVKTASLGERAATTVSRATSSTPMGSPMGGAGARGAGGEDKVHKANKFLQTTANGAALLGTPPATSRSVISAEAAVIPTVTEESRAT